MVRPVFVAPRLPASLSGDFLQSWHKSVDKLRGYVRDAEIFKDHAGAGLL